MMRSIQIFSPAVETTFELSDEVVTSLKMKAFQEKRGYSELTKDALREYLSMPKLRKEHYSENLKSS